MSSEHEYDITPDASLLDDIGAASFTVADAIAELVANSMDAHLDDARSDIEIFMGPDEIRVIDSGEGMTEELLSQAIRLGTKMDVVRPRSRPRKGMYGLGMKTAAASLGHEWRIVTRAQETDSELTVTFDLDEWRRHAGERDFKWRAVVHSRRATGGPLGDRRHGTAIVVTRLREHEPMTGPVIEKLSHAYKGHLQAGDKIAVNGTPLVPRLLEPIKKMDLDLEVALADSAGRIRGWVGLDKQTHNDSFYGINIFRRGQLVEAWNKDWFPSHLMTSRIIGEVDLEFADANFYKIGFRRQSPAWQQASRVMTEYLKPLVKASREMSRGRADSTRVARAIDGLERAMGHVSEMGELIGTAPEDREPPLAEDRPAEISVDAETLLLPEGRVHLTYCIENWLESEEIPWGYIFDDDSAELQAVLNSNSRLFKSVSDEKFLGMLALADCVVEFLVERRGIRPDVARDVRNRWLYLTLAK